MDRLTMPEEKGMCLCNGQVCCPDENCSDVCLQERMGKLWEYENAEEQGLFVRLPCKVGDTVYTIYDNGEDKPQIETRNVFDVSTATIWVDSYRYRFPYDCFGKTLFRTREDAEKAKQNGQLSHH